jgi:hypothetical protein
MCRLRPWKGIIWGSLMPVSCEFQQWLIIRQGGRVKHDFLFSDLMPPVNSIKMRAMFRFLFLWMALAVPRASAGFSSIYVFGDGVSNTNNPPTSGGATNYHGDRFCNGRVFVEVLSDWQGVTFDDTKNKSNFGNDSSVLLANVNNLDLSAFTQQQVANFLFIVWANNADFVDFAGVIDTPYGDETPWDASISQSLSNHIAAVTTLYNKGARKIVMPNAVDIMRTPFYNDFDEDDRLFVRQQIDGINDIGGYQGRWVTPMRKRSHSRAAPRPSLMAQTTRDWPRRMSPAAKTPGTLVVNLPCSAFTLERASVSRANFGRSPVRGRENPSPAARVAPGSRGRCRVFPSGHEAAFLVLDPFDVADFEAG